MFAQVVMDGYAHILRSSQVFSRLLGQSLLRPNHCNNVEVRYFSRLSDSPSPNLIVRSLRISHVEFDF